MVSSTAYIYRITALPLLHCRRNASCTVYAHKTVWDMVMDTLTPAGTGALSKHNFPFILPRTSTPLPECAVQRSLLSFWHGAIFPVFLLHFYAILPRRSNETTLRNRTKRTHCLPRVKIRLLLLLLQLWCMDEQSRSRWTDELGRKNERNSFQHMHIRTAPRSRALRVWFSDFAWKRAVGRGKAGTPPGSRLHAIIYLINFSFLQPAVGHSGPFDAVSLVFVFFFSPLLLSILPVLLVRVFQCCRFD